MRKLAFKQLAALAILVMSLALVLPLQAADYDVVILNGRVMDPETNFDQQANVGIKDGKIAVITRDEISGEETIDATGLAVAPGFIDGHQHAIEPYAYRLMLRDGRTTIMDLEVGSYGPNVDKFYKAREGNVAAVGRACGIVEELSADPTGSSGPVLAA